MKNFITSIITVLQDPTAMYVVAIGLMAPAAVLLGLTAITGFITLERSTEIIVPFIFGGFACMLRAQYLRKQKG